MEQPLRYLWKSVLNDYCDIAQIDFNEFRAHLSTWEGLGIFKSAIYIL